MVPIVPKGYFISNFISFIGLIRPAKFYAEKVNQIIYQYTVSDGTDSSLLLEFNVMLNNFLVYDLVLY